MLNWVIGFTIIFVILPTLITIIARRELYLDLLDKAQKVSRLLDGGNRGFPPSILITLEDRFRSASEKLEHVNTIALVDAVYSQELFSLPILGRKNCEQVDNFCRKLPNLLLAFGLLGTFIGITFNLYYISEAIRGVSEVSDFSASLQPHLQGMGIAFSTSLFAILCSSLLTIFNIRFNTNAAKNYLTSSLEDYLDNIYKPIVEGDTRLDKAVNRMVDQQEDFLIRFHEKVGSVLEKTFGTAAQKIADENKIASELAQKIYRAFSESAGQIRTGADTFEHAASILNDSKDAVKSWQELQSNFMNSVSRFSQSTQDMQPIVSTLGESSKAMQSLGKQVHDLSHRSVQVAELTRQHIQTLDQTLEQAKQYLQEVSDRLQKTIGQVEVGFQSLSKIWTEESSKQLKTQEDQSQQILTVFAQHLQQFNQSQILFTQLIGNIETLESNLESFISDWAENSSQQLGVQANQTQQGQQLLENMEHNLQQFSNNQEALAQLMSTIKTLESDLHSLVDAWAVNSSRQLEEQAQQGQQFLKNMTQNLEQLSASRRDFVQLTEIIQSLESNLRRDVGDWTRKTSQQLEKQTEQGANLLNKMEEHSKHFSDGHQTLNELAQSVKSNDGYIG